MHRETRVENEVAMINLVSAALKHSNPHIVPAVYAWGSAAGVSTPFGWTVQELLPGVPSDSVFEELEMDRKKGVVKQMARIFKDLQVFELPESVTGWGGLTFDTEGSSVSAAMSTVGEGPWSSYEESFGGRIRVALREAEENPHIRGWRPNDMRQGVLREKIDAFVEQAHGLSARFEDLGEKERRSIAHTDFSKFSILSLKTSALLYPDPRLFL